MNRLEDSSLAENLTFHNHDFIAAQEDIEKVCGIVMYTDPDPGEVFMTLKNIVNMINLKRLHGIQDQAIDLDQRKVMRN